MMEACVNEIESKTQHFSQGGFSSSQLREVDVIDGSAVPHPGYRPRTQANDFILYKLRSPSVSAPIPLNFDGNIYKLHDMVVRFAHNNAKMETTVFSLDATLSGGDCTDIDKFMVAFDFKQKNLSSVHKPFWIFKPSLFDLVPFAERHESPEFHKSYAWMAEATKREKPFGESKPRFPTS